MSEPTIDEMLVWVDNAHSSLIASDQYVDAYYDGTMAKNWNAIRAILEQHRDGLCFSKMKWQDEDLRKAVQESRVECIRAFVERVTVRYAQDKRYADIQPYLHLMLDELATMEKESE